MRSNPETGVLARLWKTVLCRIFCMYGRWTHWNRVCCQGPKCTTASVGSSIHTLCPWATLFKLSPRPSAESQPCLCLARDSTDLDCDLWTEFPAWPQNCLVTVHLPGSSWDCAWLWLPSLSLTLTGGLPFGLYLVLASSPWTCPIIWTCSWTSLDLPCLPCSGTVGWMGPGLVKPLSCWLRSCSWLHVPW